ncbi:hypothetical protein NQ314_002924 [Rhamnusium bicolor]|uniref:DnaJ homolog subfamily C member 21 n=1 Tax=Rhamnusium bicolor TaxID=1586634 RepID=A0AAV8ZNI9_9CUCU|nr:hypothetical protein NQ314_002924 [Rhamnusium bicolor]
MRCHYEVLDVPRNADESEIKAAYRKLALKWHPDKNLENSEYAKEQFQIVQQAYEVLSDRQERAWYDNHREQILYGSNSEFQDNSLDVFQYFTSTCFKGYGDDKDDFYTIYRKVFENIAKEDMKFMDEKEEFCEIPSFGNSKSDYEKVSEFYAYWLNYSTKKSYVWLDPYDIREARDRRYLKLIEKENKKVRQKAKKERNEEIRNLVAFVKKRDKRVQAHKKIQEQKLIEDKIKRESLRKQKKLERQEQLNTSGAQPEWAKFDNVKSELEEIERNLAEQFGEEFSNSESEEEDDFNNLYCVACNKVFKTPKAFENHEFSKKHKENIEILREAMLKGEDFDEESNVSENLEDYHDLEDSHRVLESFIEDKIENSVTQSDSESFDEAMNYKQKKKRKPRNILSTDQHTSDIEEGIPECQEFENGFDFGSNKKQRKKNKKNSNKSSLEQTVNEEEKLHIGNLPNDTHHSKKK